MQEVKDWKDAENGKSEHSKKQKNTLYICSVIFVHNVRNLFKLLIIVHSEASYSEKLEVFYSIL